MHNITENSLHTLNSSTISKGKLIVDYNTIIITIPDNNISILEYPTLLMNSGLAMATCKGILIYAGSINVSGKRYATKKENNDFKSSFASSNERKLNIITKIENDNNKKQSNNDNNFYIYNLSIFRSIIADLSDKYDVKKSAHILFNEIYNIYKDIKQKYPSILCELMFLSKNSNGFFYKLFSGGPSLFPEKSLNSYKICDNVSILSSGNNVIYPFILKEDNELKLLKSNFVKIKAGLESIDKKEKNTEADTPIQTIDKNEISSTTPVIKNDSETKSTISQDGTIKIELDNKKLSLVLKRFNINDPDIVANVKSSMEKYLQTKGSMSREEAESTVLKSINFTLFGTDEIDEEYLSHPDKLINKLQQQSRTHKTPLEFPNLNLPIKPEDIIDIKHTTGVWRQKLEFEQTIHNNIKKLFDSISTTSNKPVKIKKITHKIIDDDVNRYLHYKVTLQNTAGGAKEPYDVELKVPVSVNDRYFKLGGNTYIMSTQQFLKPVTKTDKNEVRIITSYGVVRVGVKNLKFNPADLDQVIEYIKVKYPNLIKSSINDQIVFNDNSSINLVGNNIYTSDTEKISIDNDTGKLMNNKNEILTRNKNEYLYEILLNKISTIAPDDRLTRTKKTIPYINIYLGGIQIPLIIYLWQLKGLLTTLNDFGINYKFINKDEEVQNGTVIIEKTDDKLLAIYPKDTREKLIINGILASRMKNKFNNFDDPSEIHSIIDKLYGQKAVLNMRILTQNHIDPITKELLEFENLPTNLPNLVSTHCIDILLNKKASSLSDLKNYRARLSEMILHIMYKQLMMAHNHYAGRVDYGDENAKIELVPDYILKDIQIDAGVLQHTEPTSPVDEIFFASRTIKSGKGGVPKMNMFKPDHRIIHPSQYGIMSACTTPEAEGVGLVVSHTLTPVITNEYGSYGAKEKNTISPWGALSINEALVPFQNEMDSDRLLMAATHAKQATPTDGGEAPLIMTGAEFIVPQISSGRFVCKATNDGTIVEIDPNKTITVKYKDNTTDVFDILPRMSRKHLCAIY